MYFVSLISSRQTDERRVHSMELYTPNGEICPIWVVPATSATVGAMEVEEGHGNISVQ